jgi:hypothetical protein
VLAGACASGLEQRAVATTSAATRRIELWTGASLAHEDTVTTPIISQKRSAQPRTSTRALRLSLAVSALLLRVGFGLTLSSMHGLDKLRNPDAFLRARGLVGVAFALCGPGRYAVDTLIARYFDF